MKRLALSRIQAVSAAGGFMATDPTTLDLLGDTDEYGTYQQQLTQYGGESGFAARRVCVRKPRARASRVRRPPGRYVQRGKHDHRRRWQHGHAVWLMPRLFEPERRWASCRRRDPGAPSPATTPPPLVKGSPSFGAALQRVGGQVHKGRNIIERLPQHLHASVKKALRQAWDQDDANKAERLLRNLARRLEHEEPGVSGDRGQLGGDRSQPVRRSVAGVQV